MATRCQIGKRLPDGRIRYIYCHFDGYESGVGVTLKEHYLVESKVDALLDLGDISALGKNIGEKQDFNNRNKKEDWCLAYGRDRGETGVDAVITDKWSEFMQQGIAYLYENNQWTSYN